MSFFITKKQKTQMKERKRKKKMFAEGNVVFSNSTSTTTTTTTAKKKKETATTSQSTVASTKKRPRSMENEMEVKNSSPSKSIETASSSLLTTTTDTSPVIIIPANLSAKDQKKFRKDARRQARAEGRDETKLQFMVEGEEPKDPPPNNENKKKKRKLEFPKINDLVKEATERKTKEVHLAEMKEAEAKLSETYKSRYVAMDCEMVGIGSKGKQSVLARVSLVNWQGDVLLDTFVQVPARVTDFRTWVSGVKPKDIKESKAMEVAKCRETVSAILKGKVVVGHALKNDFSALMLTHPKEDIRDTAKYRRFQRYGGNKWRPRKLRDLVLENLGLVIQEEGHAHDSIDDAKAAMDLFKLAREEWEKELEQQRKKQKK